jgi:hypothetical protein
VLINYFPLDRFVDNLAADERPSGDSFHSATFGEPELMPIIILLDRLCQQPEHRLSGNEDSAVDSFLNDSFGKFYIFLPRYARFRPVMSTARASSSISWNFK